MRVLSWWRLMGLSSFSFAGTLAANTLDPAVYGHLVLQLSPDRPNTLLGFSTFAASVVAILVGPVFGALSDRTRSRFGPRLPYFLAGVPILVLSLYLIALAPSIPVFVGAIILYRIGDNLVFPAWQALYPDHVPLSQRGLAAGQKSLLDLIAVLVGRFVAGELMGRVPELGGLAVLLAVSMPVMGLLISLAVTWRAVGGLPLPPIKTSASLWDDVRGSFRMDWRANPAFTWWFINRTLFWTAFVTLGTFLLFFIIDVIGLPEADAQRFLARFSLVLGGAIMVFAIPSGRLADRLGRKPLIVLGCSLAAVGTLLVVLVRDLNWLTVAGVLVGIGSGLFISADFALLTDIIPNREAARVMGIANIASAGGGALARLLGGLLIDPINALTGSRATGYLILYSLAALWLLLSVWAARRLPEPARQAS